MISIDEEMLWKCPNPECGVGILTEQLILKSDTQIFCKCNECDFKMVFDAEYWLKHTYSKNNKIYKYLNKFQNK